MAGDPGKRSERRSWLVGAAIAAALFGLVAGQPLVDRLFPWLRGPAPSWMGLVLLAVPVVAGVVYVGSRMRDARRRRRGWAAGAGRRDDRDGGCGGGGSGCSGSDNGCGSGSGCGGGCGGGD